MVVMGEPRESLVYFVGSVSILSYWSFDWFMLRYFYYQPL